MSEWLVSLHATVRHLPDVVPPSARHPYGVKALCSWAAVTTPGHLTEHDLRLLPMCKHCERKARSGCVTDRN